MQLLLNVKPDLSILEVGVELDDLHSLLFSGSEVMQIEAYTVEGAKDSQSQIEGLCYVLHQLVEIRLGTVECKGLCCFKRLLETTIIVY